MSFVKLLFDKGIAIFLYIVQMVLIAVLIRLAGLNASWTTVIVFILTFVGVAIIVIEYIRKNGFYKQVENKLNMLEKKFLIADMIERPMFYEGDIFYETVRQAAKSMNDEILKCKISQKEYKEYIETWIHEIKTPIANLDLICENNKSETTKCIRNEINSIAMYVEQALFYARSTSLEKDFCVSQTNLKNIVRDAVKKSSQALIAKNFEIDIKIDDIDVAGDGKWLEFVFKQVIQNSIRYVTNKKPRLTFESLLKNKNTTVLKITDNGVGICEKDLPKVFEKGFIGENGRHFGRSTGIGLYLCKKLCDKMNIGTYIESKDNCGTTISFIFPSDHDLI